MPERSMPTVNIARIDEAFRVWKRDSGHYLPGTYVGYAAGFRDGYQHALLLQSSDKENPRDAANVRGSGIPPLEGETHE
jgi:hypothetical protein